jgi:hypothetical protein
MTYEEFKQRWVNGENLVWVEDLPGQTTPEAEAWSDLFQKLWQKGKDGTADSNDLAVLGEMFAQLDAAHDALRDRGGPRADHDRNRSLLEGWLEAEHEDGMNKRRYVRRWFKREFRFRLPDKKVDSWVKRLKRQIRLAKSKSKSAASELVTELCPTNRIRKRVMSD